MAKRRYIIVYIFSKKEMDLKKTQKPASPVRRYKIGSMVCWRGFLVAMLNLAKQMPEKKNRRSLTTKRAMGAYFSDYGYVASFLWAIKNPFILKGSVFILKD